MIQNEVYRKLDSEARLDYIRLSGGQRPDRVLILDNGDGSFDTVAWSSRSDIFRPRRITGYLSDSRNFHKAKSAELHDRTPHAKMGPWLNRV